jgi:hypothetical protein
MHTLFFIKQKGKASNRGKTMSVKNVDYLMPVNASQPNLMNLLVKF